MWNFSLTIPSFTVLLVFLTYYIIRPSLPIRMNRTFLLILMFELLVTVSDFLASKALEKEWMDALPSSAPFFLNMLFFIFFAARIYCYFSFTIDALKIRPDNTPFRRGLAAIPLIITELVMLSNFFFNTIFKIVPDGEKTFVRGPLYDIIYVEALFYLGFSLILTLIYRKKVPVRAFASVFAYNMVLLIGYGVRILLPGYLVMPLFCLIAIIIIYLSFENPDFNISDRGTIFNAKAFRDILEDLTRKKSYRVFGFVLRNYIDERGIYGGMQMDEGISAISKYLAKTFPEYKAFYLRSGRFVLTGSGSMDWTMLREEIFDRFQKSWKAKDTELYLNVAFVQIGWESQVRSVDKIVNNLFIAFDKANSTVISKDSVIDLDHIKDIDIQVDVKRALEMAIDNNAVEVYLQPVIDCKTRNTVGAEALARVFDSDGNMISPGLFIPIAEKNGHINELGEQVLEKTCRFIKENDIDEYGISWINVNLSPIQCLRKDLAVRFSAILDEYQVSADKIHLEITEQSIADFSVLQKQIEALRRNGFNFALDDYGSGYSNLIRVKHYPFINIKIDMEVVWDYFRERDALLPTIIKAFKQMNFSITAEGIENAEMAEAMADIGCDFLQGFYFSKPVPMSEFKEKYLKH